MICCNVVWKRKITGKGYFYGGRSECECEFSDCKEYYKPTFWSTCLRYIFLSRGYSLQAKVTVRR
jgi:hypothetical protein